METGPRPPQSRLEDESALRWGFLEQEPQACAVVSARMELVFMNATARRIVPPDWFGRRCFEIFPHADELCAFCCPTIAAVHRARDIMHCEEVLRSPDGTTVRLGVAVIPLGGASDDGAAAVLLLQAEEGAPADPRARLQESAERLRDDVLSRFHRL